MFIFGILAWLISIPVLALTEVSTQIHDIDYGQKKGDDILVFLTSGKVAKVRPGNAEMMKDLAEVKSMNKSAFRFILNKDRYIVDIRPSSEPLLAPDFSKLNSDEKSQYVPTTIASMDIAKKYHKEARVPSKAETQCFNRAMVWTYEWWLAHSLRSQKILIYWSRTYIRRYNFEWWFHIAPYVHIMHNGKVVERVLDAKYTRGPLEFRKWTNVFTNGDPECRVITKYSEYADYPYSGICYIQRTNMYTYQPADLQMHEAWNYTKTNFRMEEVRAAYLEAFDERI